MHIVSAGHLVWAITYYYHHHAFVGLYWMYWWQRYPCIVGVHTDDPISHGVPVLANEVHPCQAHHDGCDAHPSAHSTAYSHYIHTLIIIIPALMHTYKHTLAYPLLYANLYQQLNHHLSMSLMLPPCSVLVCSRSRPVERSIISSSSHSAPASSHYLHYPPILW